MPLSRVINIKKVDVFSVAIPFHRPFEIAKGKFSEKQVIVKIASDTGTIGYGEAKPSPVYYSETVESIISAINNYFKPILYKSNAAQISNTMSALDRALVGNPMAKSAVEIALMDLVGKIFGIPVYEFLGGKVREEVEVVWSVGFLDADQAAIEAAEKIEQGFKIIKIKIGRDPKEDIKRVERLRQAVDPSIKIRVDANEAYKLEDAIEVLRRMEDFQLELIEQPVPRWDLRAMRYLRSKLNTPIMVCEGVFSPSDVINIIREEAADIIHVKIFRAGGLYNAKNIVSVAEAGGLPCGLGSMLETGIGTAAQVALASACSHITYGCTALGPLLLSKDVIEEGLTYRQGKIVVSDLPGLGVTVNEELLTSLITE